MRTALLICGGCDVSAEFEIGLDLILHGLAYLATLRSDMDKDTTEVG